MEVLWEGSEKPALCVSGSGKCDTGAQTGHGGASRCWRRRDALCVDPPFILGLVFTRSCCRRDPFLLNAASGHPRHKLPAGPVTLADFRELNGHPLSSHFLCIQAVRSF